MPLLMPRGVPRTICTAVLLCVVAPLTSSHAQTGGAQPPDPVARHRAEFAALQKQRSQELDSLELDPSAKWAEGTFAEGLASATAFCRRGEVRITVAQPAMEAGYTVRTTWFASGRPFFSLEEGGVVGGRLSATARWYWRFEDDQLVRALGVGNRSFRVDAPAMRRQADEVREEALAVSAGAAGCARR